jgi:hypothetical protein
VTCKSPIDFEALVAYWLGELPAAIEAPLEEHFFGCAHCTRRLEELSAMASGIRAAVRAGTVAAVISVPFLEQMKRAGFRIREYRVPPGGTVNCTIRADDDAVVGRMQAPLAGVKRLDALQSIEIGGQRGPDVRLEDVPFDPASGEVLHIPPAAWLKTLPANTSRVTLIAVDEAGERELGEYTFAHTPG